MKTQLILKIAVVAMAAFGAYAFSGNTNVSDLKPFYIKDGKNCTNILARCSENSLGPVCMIWYNNESIPILELGCETQIRHDDSQPVEWQ